MASWLDWLSLLLLSSFHRMCQPPTLGQLQCWQTNKKNPFFSKPSPKEKGGFSSFSSVRFSSSSGEINVLGTHWGRPWCLWEEAEQLRDSVLPSSFQAWDMAQTSSFSLLIHMEPLAAHEFTQPLLPSASSGGHWDSSWRDVRGFAFQLCL